ncbi:MAG: OmpA/MotB family protein [Owenweeksia sp.]
MKKVLLLSVGMALMLGSCVSKKKYTTLKDQYQECEDKLSTAKLELAGCLADAKAANQQIEYLRNTNYKLLNNVGNLSVLSKREAQNLEKSLETIKEKDLQITKMMQALNKKDSVTLALVTSLKGAFISMDDEDIQIQVEKGVVFVSISDKLLFKSGSYEVTDKAREVLGKVAKVVQNRPELDVMVEGHTDNKPFQKGQLQDNWDLSVKRATTIVRILENDFKVSPQRLTAAGKSYYIPVADNATPNGRAANRRTRIIVLPKLDQFFGMIEDGMKASK